MPQFAAGGGFAAWSSRLPAIVVVGLTALALGAVDASAKMRSIEPGAAADAPGPVSAGMSAGDLSALERTERGGARRGVLCQGAQDPCWFEGVSESSEFVLCPPLTGTGYVNTWTGYWVSGNGNSPAIGDRYYGHIVAGVVGSACGGKFIDTEIILPGNTKLDLGSDQGGRVRCFYTSGQTGNTSEVTDDPNAFCKSYGPGAYDGIHLGGRIVPNFGTFEIIFPLRTNARLRGLGGNDKMVAAVQTEDSNSLVAPEQYVTVVPSTISVAGRRDGTNERFDGVVGPPATGRVGAPVKIVLAKKRNGRFRQVDSGNVPIQDAAGTFAATAPRPGGGSCKVTASYPVKQPVVKDTDTFPC